MYNINYHIVCSVKYRRKMYEKFPDLRQQLWKGELWNHSYYLETIGDISEETIRKYIEHQSKQYWRKEGPCQRQERKRTVLSSVFLYGRPNKEKLVILQQMQNSYTALINRDIDLLEKNPDIVLQLVKNDKKDPQMRKLEKAIRPEGINSAFC